MDDDSNLDQTIQDDLDRRNREPKGPIREKISNEAKKHAKNAAKKARKKARATMFKSVGISVFSTFFSIFIIIFMIIGIISFITSMPGFVQESIMNKVLEGKNMLFSLTEGSDYYLNELAEDIDHKAQKEVLKYLDDMGIDPAGFGFAAFYERYKVTDEETGEVISDEVEYDPDLSSEITMDGNGFVDAQKYRDALKEATINSDLIFKYIISNERTYLVDDFDKIGNWKISEKLKSWFGKGKDLKGMIKTGIDGLDDSQITVDRENKVMEITSTNWSEWGAEQTARYNLETYAGRYGMPLEFLVALHIATMAPGLTDEMITNPNLQTEVNISMKKDDYKVDYEIKYDGEDLPIRRGTQESLYNLQYLNEDYIKQDSNGKMYLDVSEEEIEDLREKVTINSLQGWISNIRNMNFENFEDGNLLVQSTEEAKSAILGDGMFRVVYKFTGANINRSVIDWSTFLGTTDYVSKTSSSKNKYLSSAPEYMTSNCHIEAIDNSPEYRNAPAKEITTPVGDTIILSTMYEYPELNNIYNTSQLDGFYYTGIMHGLDYYLNGHESELKREEVSLGLTCLLTQFDAYLYEQNLSQYSEARFTRVATKNVTGAWNEDGEQYDLGRAECLRTDVNGGNSELYLLLTKEWMDFCNSHNGIKNCSNEEIHNELTLLAGNIQNYFQMLQGKDTNIQDLLNDLYDKLGYDVQLTPDDIQVIYDALNSQTDEFEYAFPKIQNVIKHWFKDVIFETDEFSIYQQVSDSRRIKVDVDNDRLEVYAIMSDGTNFVQKGQPYVVKGDTVTLDGEAVEDERVSGLTFENDDGTVYKVGDGYRTTKKLFTQGQYYTFDGSQETAKSIWYAQELEKLDGKTKKYAKVHVKNGRISVACVFDDDASAMAEFGGAYDASTGTWNESSRVIDPDRERTILGKSVASGDGWSVFLAKATKQQSSGDSVDVYYIAADKSLAYISVGSEKADIVTRSKESVERINSMLDAMGVAVQRKPISFDNTTASGDVTTLTAFSILEGMHSESAEYIYRDLKEFLIDLGYYTKAEFDYLSTDTLEWFIPEYNPQTTKWRQNREEDALYYGAMLYPAAIDTEGELTGNGFEPGLEVIAPGNARILELRENGIKLEFDGISEPKIGMLDKYTMLIDGINVDRSAVVVATDIEGNEKEMTLQEILESNGTYSVKASQVIGSTDITKIQIIMKNNKGAYIDNVEDYMYPMQKNARGTMGDQEYPFTDDEVILLAYIINHEASPEGIAQYAETSGLASSVYETAEDWAMAYSEAVGYVLINRALNNYGGFGSTIEEQSTYPGQYDGSFTIEYAKQHQSEISAGSMEAAEYCAQNACTSIVNPDGVEMTQDVTGESAWTFGHRIFWWLDTTKDGIQDFYPESPSEPGYPTNANWPWDGYLTYTD